MKLHLLSFLLLSFTFGLSQNSFITVNQDSISVQEFKKEYKKNIETEGIDKAVETFINFKLMQQEAEKTRVDTTAVFAQIYAQSIQPEREKYLYNPIIKEKLISEIWNNLQSDRKVEIHAIGVQNPFDKEQEKERLLLVQDLHQLVCNNKPSTSRVDTYIKENEDKSLWIRPMTISAEIERTVYQTPVGQCSQIQSSENGNFFVKVLEERPSSGIITLEYIHNKDRSELLKAQKALEANEDWDDVKKAYHQTETRKDLRNKVRYEAEIPSEFLKAIQEIKTKPYTEPFAARDGFYLIQVYKLQTFDKLENWENFIEKKIPQTEYALTYVQNVENRANQVVEIKEDKNSIEEVLKTLGKDFYSTEKEINFTSDKNIWSTDEQSFTQQNLLEELLLSKQYLNKNTDFNKLIEITIPKYKNQFILNNYLSNLQKYEPDFAEASHMLKEAIKVNHFIEYEVYAQAEMDSLGMKKYLNDNVQTFTWPTRYDLEIYRYKNPEDANTIANMLKKRKNSDEILKHFEGKRDKNGALAVVLTRGKFSLKDNDMPTNFNPKKKIQSLTYRNVPAIVKLNQKINSQPKTLGEASNELKEVYKMHRYEETLKKLRNNATISIPQTL